MMIAFFIFSALVSKSFAGFCNDHLQPKAVLSVANEDGAFKQKFIQKFEALVPTLHFQLARPSDVPALQKFINRVRGTFIESGATLNQVFDDDLEHMDETYLNSQSTLFIITDRNHEIVGSGGFARTKNDEAELRKIYFDPSLHGTRAGNEGKTLGKLWIASLTQLAQDLGIQRIWLQNHINLARATSIYRGLGYEDFTPPKEIVGTLSLGDYWFLEINHLQTWKYITQ